MSQQSMWFCYSLKYDQTKYVVSVVKTKLILLLSLSQRGAGFCIPFPVLGPVGCARTALLWQFGSAVAGAALGSPDITGRNTVLDPSIFDSFPGEISDYVAVLLW